MASTPQDPERVCQADLAMVRRILRGERDHVSALAERLRCIPFILEALNARRGSLLSEEELADLSQDVLVVVWRKLGEYEGLSPLEGWVYGISFLELMNSVRRKLRSRQDSLALARLPGAEAEAVSDPDPWAFEDLHRGLLRIGKLHAQVIRLKHFDGLTFDEIARRLGISSNTVKARYYRGLGELRPLLAAGGPGP
jgi:RNA polymerase sigma-70 factor, ECF subfamily